MKYLKTLTLAALLTGCTTSQDVEPMDYSLSKEEKHFFEKLNSRPTPEEKLINIHSYLEMPPIMLPVPQEELELFLSKYAQGKEIIAKDTFWHDLYHFLHRITSPTNDYPAKLELTKRQQEFVQKYEREDYVHPDYTKNYMEYFYLLHEIIPESEKMLQPLSRADLIFLSEITGTLRRYISTGKMIKPQYDITTYMQLRHKTPDSPQKK